MPIKTFCEESRGTLKNIECTLRKMDKKIDEDEELKGKDKLSVDTAMAESPRGFFIVRTVLYAPRTLSPYD